MELMASVDVRTRSSADVRPVDAAELFDRELPRLAQARAALVGPGAAELAPRPLAVEVEGRAWTLAFIGDAVEVVPGESGASAAVRLTALQVDDLVNDLVTPMGWFTGGTLDQPAGRLDDLLDWWVVLRGLLDERPVHTAGAVDFLDREGRPLDLQRSFGPDSDRDEMAHFLAEAGYIHLASRFDRAEMRALADEMDAAAPRYHPGDGRSWWARTRNGDERLVRLQFFQTESPTTAQLLEDPRLQSIAELTDDDHRLGKPGGNRNLVEALVKPIGVVEGISDVPWHKDCSLGSHSYRCCSMTVGVSVTGADAGSGQLRVVAGSHRALIQPAFVRRDLDLPQVDLPTRTGDVTVHLSCTLHMSQPPVDHERRVLYTDFRLPDPDGDRSPGEAALKQIREAAPLTVSQTPA
jgi:hypothetical protein